MSKTKAGKDVSWIGEELLLRGLTLHEITNLYDRVLHCLDSGEDAVSLFKRLNPVKATDTPSWVPKPRVGLPAGRGDIPWETWKRIQRQKALNG